MGKKNEKSQYHKVHDILLAFRYYSILWILCDRNARGGMDCPWRPQTFDKHDSTDWHLPSLYYDMAIRNTLCRLSALLLQAVFNLWSLLWFSSLPTLGTYEAEYERTGVLPENMIPSNENNFYFCWIVGAVIILYLVVAMTISYVMKLYAGSKRFTDKWTGSRQPCNKHLWEYFFVLYCYCYLPW